jgi:ABC-2 type transport system ATP-binding protein
MAVVEARGLTKVFRTWKKPPGLAGAIRGLFHREYEERRAADGVSFSIEEGEFVGFLGPNGAGKTTVLKMLSGLLNPTSGEASVLGFTPWERKNAMKRQFALLMGQKNALWWDLPARESLELNRAIYDIPQRDFDATVDMLTTLLDVRDHLSTAVRELSLGERMKMELIAALLHKPRVLFLDEPTIGLDVTSQKAVREFMRDYNRGQKIVTMLTSHYMGDIQELCHRVIIIDEGRIFHDGPLSQIIDRFATHKEISLTFAAPVAESYVCDGATLVEKKGTAMRIRIPRARVAETCREILAHAANGTLPEVNDIAVADPPVEDVIRDLFADARKEREPAQ